MVEHPDPITIEVLRGALDALADEMELVLLRSSHSTVINEALDATSAIFDAQGRTVAQAVSLPVHLGVLVEVGKRIAARFRPMAKLEKAISTSSTTPTTAGHTSPTSRWRRRSCTEAGWKATWRR